MFQFLGQKNPVSDSDSDVSLFTRIRTQRGHVNSLGIVLSETVVMVSLSAPLPRSTISNSTTVICHLKDL